MITSWLAEGVHVCVSRAYEGGGRGRGGRGVSRPILLAPPPPSGTSLIRPNWNRVMKRTGFAVRSSVEGHEHVHIYLHDTKALGCVKKKGGVFSLQCAHGVHVHVYIYDVCGEAVIVNTM